jgi:integrase
MMLARRESSTRLYDTYIARWKLFCAGLGLDFLEPDIPHALQFLQNLLDQGLGYSVVNTARSALSAIILTKNGLTFGSQPDVILFMKGAFNMRPTKPRYTSTWDTSQVLTFLETWIPASEISLEKLTLKLMVLILLITGQRPQLLTKLDISNMKTGDDYYEFFLSITDFKQGRIGYKPGPIRLKQYVANRRLCVFQYLSYYLQRTALLRKDYTALFLTYKKPHRPVSQNSVSRWIKNVLQLAGIDISTFSAGSTRSAAASKVRDQGAPIHQIMEMGGWSRASTFTRFYDRPILPHSVAERILDAT